MKVTLKSLKEEFTKLTGLPAKKAFVEAVCVGAGLRTMRSLIDWEWAIRSVAPQFLVNSPEISDLELANEELIQGLDNTCAAYEQQFAEFKQQLATQKLMYEQQLADQKTTYEEKLKKVSPSPTSSDCIEIPVFELTEEQARRLFSFVFSFSGDNKATYKQLHRLIHPDLNQHRVAIATSLSIVLNELYEKLKNQENDIYHYAESKSRPHWSERSKTEPNWGEF